jgi:two-component system, sensor histidine kinase and response regulator
MIVHDLKSPLSAMLATVEVVADGDVGPLAEEQRELLTRTQNHGAEMLQLIDDLLELTRLEESRLVPERESMAVDRLLTELSEEWRLRLERDGVTLRVDDRAGRLSVHADLHLLRRVLANLVGNALRHAGSGIEIRVSAGPAGQEPGVLFSVEDNGVGIPRAYHESIFQKFGSLPRGEMSGGSSSGIGLAFCRLAVEAHGGRIWVESVEGSGSAFRFVIPDRPLPPVAAGAVGDAQPALS